MAEVEFEPTFLPPPVDVLPVKPAAGSPQTSTPETLSKDANQELSNHVALSDLVERTDKVVQSISTKISFAVDSQGKDTIIIVSERETGKIIRQIPPQEMRELAAKMEELVGIIFHKKV